MKLTNFKDIVKYNEELSKGKVECSCGHRIIFPPRIDMVLCHWCGNYVFRTKKAEFEYRMQERLRKEKSNGK